MERAIEKSDFCYIATEAVNQTTKLVTKEHLRQAVNKENIGIITLLLQFPEVEINDAFETLHAANLDIISTFLDSSKLKITQTGIKNMILERRIDVLPLILNRFKVIRDPKQWLCDAIDAEQNVSYNSSDLLINFDACDANDKYSNHSKATLPINCNRVTSPEIDSLKEMWTKKFEAEAGMQFNDLIDDRPTANTGLTERISLRVKEFSFPKSAKIIENSIFKLLWNDIRFQSYKTSCKVINRIIITQNIALLNFVLLDLLESNRIQLLNSTILHNTCIKRGTEKMFELLMHYTYPNVSVMIDCLVGKKDNYIPIIIKYAKQEHLEILLHACIVNGLSVSIDKLYATGKIIININTLFSAIELDQICIAKHLVTKYKIESCEGTRCAARCAVHKKNDNLACWLFGMAVNCKHLEECLKISIMHCLYNTVNLLVKRIATINYDVMPMVLRCKNLKIVKLILSKIERVDHVTILDMINEPRNSELLSIICDTTKIDLFWQDCKLVKTAVLTSDDNALTALLGSRKLLII